MEHWYVYYKLEPAQLSAWLPQVPALFDAVARAAGVRGRLLRRADEAGTTVTVMEVYDGVTDGAAFATALADALNPLRAVPQPRRTERFIAFAGADAGPNP